MGDYYGYIPRISQMKTSSLRWIFTAFFIFISVSIFVSPIVMFGMSGTSGASENHELQGTTPVFLAIWIVNLSLYLLLILCTRPDTGGTVPTLLRRFCAGYVDFVMAFFFIFPIGGLLQVLFEYRRTGVFVWMAQERNYLPFDQILGVVLGLIFMFILMPLYAAFPLCVGKPTPGSCVCNYRIAGREGRPLSLCKAMVRTYLGVIALFGWPFWILAYWVGRDKKAGKFWLDALFATHAEFLD
jgi:hypothetical protein